MCDWLDTKTKLPVHACCRCDALNAWDRKACAMCGKDLCRELEAGVSVRGALSGRALEANL